MWLRSPNNFLLAAQVLVFFGHDICLLFYVRAANFTYFFGGVWGFGASRSLPFGLEGGLGTTAKETFSDLQLALEIVPKMPHLN